MCEYWFYAFRYLSSPRVYGLRWLGSSLKYPEALSIGRYSFGLFLIGELSSITSDYISYFDSLSLNGELAIRLEADLLLAVNLPLSASR